jgi:hypothetical protein
MTFETDFPFKKKYVSRETIDCGETSFHVADQKGRDIGYFWQIDSITLRDRTDADQHWYNFASNAEHQFEAWTSVTRNGQRYGASQSSLRADNLDDLKAKIAKRTEDARKRYTKQFALPKAGDPGPEELAKLFEIKRR